MQNKLVLRLTFIASVLALCVVILGAYTRLTDAGLGCPDWPTCYNHLTVPKETHAVQQAQMLYPGFPLNAVKAWTEMVHRYVASTLGLLILSLLIIAIVRRQQKLLPTLLVGLVIFQALLGMWTVTLRLNPLVVMSHLLGGFSILSLLWCYFLRESKFLENNTLNYPCKKLSSDKCVAKPIVYLAIIGLVILIGQIILGGWTSANNAALACPNFPACISHQFLPQTNFLVAFNFLHSAMIHLSYAALVTIHMMHRFGALITGIYLLSFAILLLRIPSHVFLKKLAAVLLALLILQISLGIMNVVLYLPLAVAVLHNAIAALLLLSMVTINFYLLKQART